MGENTSGTNKGRYLLLDNKLWERERLRQKSRGTGELLYIDQHIFNMSKTRRKNLDMAWVDNKKAYDMVLESCVINCLKMY